VLPVALGVAVLEGHFSPVALSAIPALAELGGLRLGRG
jgi:hypothetical protein